jgi:hypothetical protein
MNHGEHFQYKLADIREKKLTEIDTIELTYLKIEGKNIRTIEIESRPDQTEEESPVQYRYMEDGAAL